MVISRYTPDDFAELWSNKTHYSVLFDVELSACEVMETVGIVPSGTTGQIRSSCLHIDIEAIEAIEKDTLHEMIAFLTYLEKNIGNNARWLHFGMTSSDILDTSLSILLVRAVSLLLNRIELLIESLKLQSIKYAKTPMIGRSHGMHAEPVTFGIVLAGHLAEIKRSKKRLIESRSEISIGKISGAVGTYSHLTPEIEKKTLENLGLLSETVSTQVIARDRHANLFNVMALTASAIERLAINIRHWQRTEVGEIKEAFKDNQKGSSAMPHKQNPILSENLCGLARIVRASVIPAMENISLWHERDISHSSVERIMIPDITTILGFMLDRITKIIDNFVVDTNQMMKNLNTSKGIFFSEDVMLALINKGINRKLAYEMVQRNALKSFNSDHDFHSLLNMDNEICNLLKESELNDCFNLDYSLRWAKHIVLRSINA
ncbi:MAG TPA: adenylosuccinate lyase [Ignavibacteria bacterium]|nr:adenylosuccinate lyase [Ignavibacteria bacterium]